MPGDICIYVLDHLFTSREYDNVFAWMKDRFKFVVNKYNLQYDVDTFI